MGVINEIKLRGVLIFLIVLLIKVEGAQSDVNLEDLLEDKILKIY